MTEFNPYSDSDFSALARLCGWYSLHCDGEREHQYGINIQSMDNPGWALTIALADTMLDALVAEQKCLRRSEHDWIKWSVGKDKGETKFIAYGGPNNLAEMIHAFVMWATNPQGTQQSDVGHPQN
ncbi:MAG: hypothetical protein ACI89L_000485 [Phycisphaerales bacterium]|jgi:hypothetical protein